MYKTLCSKLGSVQGCVIEDNRFSLSLHYRNIVKDTDTQMCEKVLDETLNLHADTLVKTYGKKVWEVRPRLQWHKGSAVQFLLKQLYPHLHGDGDGDGVLAVYIGDDRTDEDAFEAVNALNGLSILVSAEPRLSHAKQQLTSPKMVLQWLRKLADLQPTL